jgi:hypothetical protein
MHRTTLHLPDRLFRTAKIKATSERVPLSQVIRTLLDRWVAGEVVLGGGDRSRQEAVERARKTFGMWRDKDADRFLRESRMGLSGRDREIEDARQAP